MSKVNQLTLDQMAPGIGEAVQSFPYLPVAPLDLTQEAALWLVGQRLIDHQRYGRYLPESVDHPGKMFPDLAGAIIDTYTQPGDVIIDCMGGIMTTGVEAIERGRHFVGVELEGMWVQIGQANLDLVYERAAHWRQDVKLGAGLVIHGDARRLPDLLAGLVDAIVTSPPYGEALGARTGRIEGRTDRLLRLIEAGALPRGVYNGFAQSNRGSVASFDPNYSPKADVVFTSPPYGNTLSQHPGATDREARIERMRAAGITVAAEDIGGPNGTMSIPQTYADAAVISPPYGPSQTGGGIALAGTRTDPRPMIARCGGRAYDTAVDAVVTSPPYGDSRLEPGLTTGLHFGRDPEDVTQKKERQGKVPVGYDGTEDANRPDVSKSQRTEQRNIGNLKYGDYLQAMEEVYAGCFRVLKPGGLLILVTKDFRRNNRRIKLLADTTALCEKVGFVLVDRVAASLSPERGGDVIAKVSPFRRINARKAPKRYGYPEMLPVFEDVTVFVRPKGRRGNTS